MRKYFESEAGALEWADNFERDVREKGTVAVLAGGKTLSDVLRRFWASKTFVGHHKRLAEFYLDKFEDHRGGAVFCGLTPFDIETFWKKRKWSGTTRLQSLRYLNILWDWAERYDYCQRNIAKRVERPKSDAKEKRILLPGEMKKLLKLADPMLKGFLSFGGFAGLRTSEFLNNPQIEKGHILASGKTGKRYVKVLPAFTRHLPAGKFVSPDERTFRRHRDLLVTAMGWEEWPDNCLRHSFATYHLAMYEDAPRTAFQMGHSSPQMVNKVYAKPAITSVARAWWRL